MSNQEASPGIPWTSRLPHLIFLAVVVFFATNPFTLLDFPLDDAWIHRVYSQSFAQGHGFEYNPGRPEAGSTSPLWSIVTSPAHWLEPLGTTAVVLSVKFIAIVLALLSIEAARRIGTRICRSAAAGTVAASALALDPRLAFSALSGMETILLLSLWLGAALCLTKRRFALGTLCMCLTPVTRPEALVILPFFVMAAMLAVVRGTLQWHKLAWLAMLPVPMVLWSLFCKSANGRWLPTTFYMKSTTPEFGREQLLDAWRLLGLNGPLPSAAVAMLIILAVYILLRTHKNIEALLLLVAAPLAFLTGVLFSREFFTEGYYWLRWTDPAVLVITFAAVMVFTAAIDPPKGWKSRSLAILLVLLCLPHLAGAMLGWRARLVSDCRAINLITVQAGRWIDENLAEEAVIAVNDAGATRYFGRRRTIDLMGLNCADIAFGTAREEDQGIVDYLAITPAWFAGKGIYDGLPVCTNFSIPPGEYTITPNKGQSEIVIFKCE